MLGPVQLTSAEYDLLLQHKKKSLCELISIKAHAVLLFHKQYDVITIADVLFRSEKTVREWIQEFQEERIASLFPKTLQNQHAAKLTKEQKQQLKDVLAKKPSAYGIPKEFWDVSTLKQYISAEFGVEYESENSYRLIFQLHNYSFHLPDTFDIHRDEKKIEKRMGEIRDEIEPYMENVDWIVFASDESRIVWESLIRRLWLPKGQKTIIKVERKRQAQSFIGFLSLKSGEDCSIDFPGKSRMKLFRYWRRWLKDFLINIFVLSGIMLGFIMAKNSKQNYRQH
jgi:transposase